MAVHSAHVQQAPRQPRPGLASPRLPPSTYLERSIDILLSVLLRFGCHRACAMLLDELFGGTSRLLDIMFNRGGIWSHCYCTHALKQDGT